MLLPLDGMLIHCSITHSSILPVPIILYTLVKRDNVEQSFLSKETTQQWREQRTGTYMYMYMQPQTTDPPIFWKFDQKSCVPTTSPLCSANKIL